MLRILLGGWSKVLDVCGKNNNGWLTWRDVVVRFNGNVLVDFQIVNVLQDGQSVSDTGYAHLFQLIVLECDKRLALNAVFCDRSVSFNLDSTSRARLTDEGLVVLPQIQRRHELSTLFRRPFCYYRPRQTRVIPWYVEGGWCVFVGRRFRRGLRVGV
jgi:hypothetical protein